MKIVHFIGLYAVLMTMACSGPGSGKYPESPTWSADTISINRSLKKLFRHEIENADSAMKIVLRAETLAMKIGYREGEAQACFEHANLLYRKNKHKEALKKYTEAIEEARKLKMNLLTANCLERMASVHMATDDPFLALKLYYDALLLYEKVPDSMGIAKVYNILGVYKTDTKEYDSAKVFFEKAMSINRRANHRYYLIENQGNLAWMYRKMGDSKKAEGIFNELVEELTRMKDSLSLQVIYFNLAILYQDKGNYPATFKFLTKAIGIAEPVGDTVLLSTLYGNKGEVFFKTGRPDSAAIYLQKSIRCTEATGDIETEAQAIGFLMQVDSATGNSNDLYANSKRIFLLKDSIADRRLRNDLKRTELRYENEKKQALIELQNQKIVAAGKENILTRALFFILLVTTFLGGFIFFLERKNLKKNRLIIENQLYIKNLQVEKIQQDQEIDRLKIEKIEEELKSKHREMVCIAMGMEQKNELLNDISRKIQEFYSGEPAREPVAAVNEIITTIKMQVNGSGESELFNQQFALVHEKFHENLKKAHPALTKSELKFCAYLRLNVSGNQIATYLNITHEAVKKTRYRIRKKLNLSPENSLEEYISGF
ncbi:MAG: tetratricopeptide repeat protein [Bacteroidales bacterium]